MAWGLEARVPFLDRAFLDVAMNIDPKEKMFSKGKEQSVDEDGRPRMEKVMINLLSVDTVIHKAPSMSCAKRLTCHQMGARYLANFLLVPYYLAFQALPSGRNLVEAEGAIF